MWFEQAAFAGGVAASVGKSGRLNARRLSSAPNLGLARTIASHLTHESERMMRQDGKMPSAEQTKAVLTSIARADLTKLERVATLEIADGVDAAEDVE
jgi:hypothetical protein